MSVSLFLKDPASARYVAGGLAEVEELFGSPLPDLPAPEIDAGPRRSTSSTCTRACGTCSSGSWRPSSGRSAP